MALANLRLGFACKERWEDMVGDDRVRACRGCNRDVFNLSAMTRDEAEAVLAARGLTPCVRFYRRPDGTVMTTDCPTGARPERRRLAVVASSLAAGTALAAPAPVLAQPATPPDGTEMGEPIEDPLPEMGVIVVAHEKRPAVEWSIWGRLGVGIASQPPPNVVARREMPPPVPGASSLWEAAAAADLTLRVAADGNIRLGAWGELRTTSGGVAGGELVVEGLPPQPYGSRIHGSGSLVLRAGANAHLVTTELGFGYVGSWPSNDPWIPWAHHVVGARVVLSMNQSLDDHGWFATAGIEVEPVAALHAVLDLATGR